MHAHAMPPDAQPSDHVARDPAEVIAPLVESHRQFLRFLEARLGDRALAEDILQSAFAKGIERAPQLHDAESVVAWFYRLLRNAIIDHHRRAGTRQRRLDALAHELEARPDEPPADARDAVCGCVSGLLETLKPEYATALRRIDLDGLAVKAFADEAAITANNAAVRVHRARLALREQLRRCCGTCAEHGCLDCSCGH